MRPIVILTALDVEYAAIRANLTDVEPRLHPQGTRFEVGRLAGGRCRVALAQVGKGNQPAAVLTERAVNEFTPAALLFVGVAGALHAHIELGAVVVATHVYAYHGGTSEPEKPQVSCTLSASRKGPPPRARAGSTTWIAGNGHHLPPRISDGLSQPRYGRDALTRPSRGVDGSPGRGDDPHMPGGPPVVAGVDTVRGERARILGELRERVGELTAEAVRAIRAQIPAYHAANAPAPAAIHEQVLAHYLVKLDALARDRTPTADDLPFIQKAAMRRARAGFALHDYISAYRIGHQVLWDAVVAHAGASPAGHEAALSLAGPLMRYCDLATAEAAHAYTEHRRYMAAETARTRLELLDRLLEGRMPERGPVLAAARGYGLETDGRMVVLAGVLVGGNGDAETPYAACAALSDLRVVDARTLCAVRREEIVAVPTLGRTGDVRALCDRLDALRERLTDDDLALAIGVSTVVTGVAALPGAYREARAAVELLPPEGGVAALPRLSPFDYMALRADSTAGHLVDPRVRRLIEEDRARGGVLIATIRAFAASDLNLRATAARLQVHHNTAQYRLRKIAERTGRTPRCIADLIDLLVAIALADASLPET